MAWAKKWTKRFSFPGLNKVRKMSGQRSALAQKQEKLGPRVLKTRIKITNNTKHDDEHGKRKWNKIFSLIFRFDVRIKRKCDVYVLNIRTVLSLFGYLFKLILGLLVMNQKFLWQNWKLYKIPKELIMNSIVKVFSYNYDSTYTCPHLCYPVKPISL